MRALVDPSLEGFDLSRGELLAGFRRRHQFVGILGRNALEELALAALARHDHRILGSEGPLLEVEPQVGLARVRIRPMAGEAVLRQDRQDVAPEIDWLLGRREPCRECQQAKDEESGPTRPSLGTLSRDARIATIESGRFLKHMVWKLIHGRAMHGGTSPYYRPGALAGSMRNLESILAWNSGTD